MNNFGRALKDSLRYWRSLVLATLCSLFVAALWGGNIGALFPIIEVTIAGESLQSWIAGKIETSEATIRDLENQLRQARQNPGERASLLKASRLDSQLRAERASLASSMKLQPLLHRWFPNDPFLTVVYIVGLLVFATAVKHVFLLANTFLVARVSGLICRDLRRDVFQRALAMDRANFSKSSSSGFSAHITHSTQMLSNGITNVFGGAVREPLKMLACLIGASFICWRLLIVSLAIGPVAVFLAIWLSRRIKAVCKKLLQNAVGFHHVMLESFGNISTVQAFNMEQHEQQRFGAATHQMYNFGLKTTCYNALTRPITELFGIGMVGTTIIVGTYLVINQETAILGITICDRPLSISAILVFFGLLVGTSDPVRKLSNVFAGINTGMVAADMLYPLLDRTTTISNPAEPKHLVKPHHTLEFRNVCFAYQPQETILRSLNLVIPRGQHVAIVGPNGSGKSSLVNLLCRFYEQQDGQILLDGVDLRELTLADVRDRLGLVTQRTELFNEDVKYNIRYGSLEKSDQEILAASRKAHAHEFIVNQLPQRYQTKAGQNGHRLSGGQRQRIALARAILRDPEILVLDEATSQIDAESEQLIRKTLRHFGDGRTIIMITHRPARLELADKIYEMVDGQLVLREKTKRVA